MAKWKVNALAKNKAEVVTPTVRYVVQTDSSSFRLQAFKGKRSVERVSIERKKHSYALVGVDSAGRSERQTIRIAGNRVVTRGVMGGRPFAVSSSVCLHIPLLIAKLKGRRPTRLPHTSAFFTQFKTDGRLKDQLEGRVDVALMRPMQLSLPA